MRLGMHQLWWPLPSCKAKLMILFARSLSGKNPDFWPRKSPIDVSGILRRVRLAVPKIRVYALLHRMGFHSALALHRITCVVLPRAGSDHRAIEGRFSSNRCATQPRLDEQDSKIQKVSGPA